MQTRIHNKIVFECDSCARCCESFVCKTKWKTRKIGGIWFHYCPNCQPNQRKEVEAKGQRHFKGFL